MKSLLVVLNLFLTLASASNDAHARASRHLSLKKFASVRPGLLGTLSASYRKELDSFESDPGYCSKDDAYPGMNEACIRAVDREHQILLSGSFGKDWFLERIHSTSELGKVLVFTRSNILTSTDPMSCSFSVSIPVNRRHQSQFSFDYYCDH